MKKTSPALTTTRAENPSAPPLELMEPDGWRAQDQQLENRLWTAVERGDAIESLAILREKPELALKRNISGQSPLFRAILRGHERLAEALAPLSDAAMSPPNGTSPLMEAANRGWTPLVRFLLPLSNPEQANGMGGRALMRAANHDSAECLRALLPYCDPNARSEDGWTALLIAARYGRAECVRELLPVSDLALTVNSLDEPRGPARLARDNRDDALANEIEAAELAFHEREALRLESENPNREPPRPEPLTPRLALDNAPSPREANDRKFRL